jgi:hypothetical protein
MGSGPRQLRLHVDFDGDPIAGQIWSDDTEPRRFTGYASLIAVLESIREAPDRSSPPPTSPTSARP